jgi:hypothetical protein
MFKTAVCTKPEAIAKSNIQYFNTCLSLIFSDMIVFLLLRKIRARTTPSTAIPIKIPVNIEP